MSDDGSVIDLRVLGADDWQLWRELRLAALASSPEAFRTPLSYWSGPGDTEENWRALLASRPLHVVVTWNGDPAAMVSAAARTDEGAVELHSMWVAPTARGLGAGDAAVRAVLDWAQTHHQGTHVELAVKAANTPAVRLYERHGFVDAGPSPDHPDERLMRRPG